MEELKQQKDLDEKSEDTETVEIDIFLHTVIGLMNSNHKKIGHVFGNFRKTRLHREYGMTTLQFDKKGDPIKPKRKQRYTWKTRKVTRDLRALNAWLWLLGEDIRKGHQKLRAETYE